MRALFNAAGFGCLLLFVGVVACGIGVVMGAGGRSSFSFGGGSDAVAVVYVEGQSVGGDGGGVFDAPAAHSDRIVRSLKRAAEDNAVKAVVLRVDSPGGSVTASDEIFNQVMKLRAVKPVVVSMGGLAASGGYYISAGANRIFANPTTLTASIGVISIIPNVQGLLEKLGVTTYVFTSGRHKDTSAGLRALTDEDRQLFQGVVDETFERFVNIVSEGRKLPADQVRTLADGRVVTGRQALQAGLVDELGDLPEAIKAAAQLGGISGEPRIVSYRSGGFLSGGAQSLAHLLGLPIPTEALWGGQIPTGMQYLYVGP